MIAAMLLLISVVMLAQFGLFYWRAVVAGVAAQPLSDLVRAAARLENGTVRSTDFHTMLDLHHVTPSLKDGNDELGLVKAYYAALEKLARHVPPLAGWTEREMTLCSRYVAVLVDQRLERNLVCAAEMRSC